MIGLLSTSHIDFNYPLLLYVIIFIKFSVCNLTRNYLWNSYLSHCPTGLPRLCLSKVVHHETDELVQELSSKKKSKNTLLQKVKNKIALLHQHRAGWLKLAPSARVGLSSGWADLTDWVSSSSAYRLESAQRLSHLKSKKRVKFINQLEFENQSLH